MRAQTGNEVAVWPGVRFPLWSLKVCAAMCSARRDEGGDVVWIHGVNGIPEETS